MDEPQITIDPDRQERARQYARIRRRLWAVGLLLDGIYLTLWVSQRWSIGILQALSSGDWGGIDLGGSPWWVELALLTFILGAPWFVLTMPLSFYTGFTLPHRYGLSTQTIRSWVSDRVKSSVLSLMLGMPLLVGLYASIRLAPSSWWLLAAGGFTLVTILLSAIAPVILMPIFSKFRPLGEEHADLAERLMRLAKEARTRVQGVFSFDMSRRTRAANAALVGLGRTRRILLGDTLLSEFTPDEIETILAHELGHHVHRDIPLSLLIQSLLNFVAFFIASQGLSLYATSMDLSSTANPATLPFLALLMGVVTLITMPLTNAFSRWRESLADRYALEITHMPKPFASGLTRLANQNLADVDPDRWVVLLLHSHPPLNSRIKKALSFAESKSSIGSSNS